jgi:hypothetical protein
MNKSVRVPPSGDTPALECPSMLGHSQGKKLAKGWGRVIRAATSDEQLTDADTRVYDAMCQMERRGRVTCGVRYIGSVCNKSKSETARCILHLIGRGYVERLSVKAGSRAVYRLTASIFTEKHPLVDSARDNQRLADRSKRQTVDSVVCSKCRQAGKVARSGICVICIRKDNIERTIKEILTANPHATREQVYVSLKSGRAKEINSALDRLMAVSA